ncbi:OLC1v1028386C1 [Oldenlandia corymbosa var. corymbosa]|uniref:OLC1v1028386C1 n=1 Tax=Oldenlandia corymbosa var. corymbosa TaxID=529605 RepID=A0AAV1CC63_OLDCO|nr:OLC1v1028386C1 [Oldenlandia corymbosa var. corymbosa]
MARKTYLVRLLMLPILLLCVSRNLVCLNAIPVTRLRSLEHNLHGGFQFTEEITKVTKESVEIFRRPERMDLELNDYPGSGANNRHTPRAQLAKVCSSENC